MVFIKNTFNWKKVINGRTTDNKTIWIYTYHSYITTESTIEWIKLERGNKATDWSPAPEDVWYTMVDLGIIDKNAMLLNEAEKANIKYINGMFSKGADYTNGTETIKNTITTGALTVGNTLGGNAGINGAGLDGKSIRFFAGANYREKERAPFRVQDDGSIYASKGQIGNFKIESASDTSLTANGLTVASNGIIRAFGSVTNRSTQVIINDPDQLQELVGTRPATSIYSSGFGDTNHTALHLTSIGGYYNTALVLEAENGTNGATAIDIRSGDILVNGKKGFSGMINIGNIRITVTNGIITGAQ